MVCVFGIARVKKYNFWSFGTAKPTYNLNQTCFMFLLCCFILFYCCCIYIFISGEGWVLTCFKTCLKVHQVCKSFPQWIKHYMCLFGLLLLFFQKVYTCILVCNIYLCKLCISLCLSIFFSIITSKTYMESWHEIFTKRNII